ncbi:hypothetical protein QLX67_05855, partial [Balneolaceae bacterium ANBcel3]|nr:hypothetical protein [Balneolaceae bacterium ANBcel3]
MRILFLLVLLFPVIAHGQRNPSYYNYPNNHLEWYTIESDHFYVNFQEGNSRPAQVISRIAEEIYGPITQFYNYEPDQKISIVLIDRLDYSNGAAFFYDNKIEIWLPALDTPLRGTHSWLRNVITHEFTHIVQLQASMKRSRKRPAYYLQWLSYEDVRRPDVLYGFPQGLISYPFAGISMPAWLAEGTAQYMHNELFYDDWDAHRDMLLRTRILDDTYLSLEKMGTFTSKTSLERELVYNQGFAFTVYIAERFGDEAVADITRAFSERGVYDVRKAIKNVTGIDGRDLYNEWIEELKTHYTDMVSGIERDPENRTWVEPFGFYNFFPTFSPDGHQIAYVSNKFMDGALASLYLIDTEDGEELYSFEVPLFENPSESRAISRNLSGVNSKSVRHSHGVHTSLSSSSSIHAHDAHACDMGTSLVRRIETSFSFSPDGSKIAYSRARLNTYGEQYRDLYLFDIESGDSRRLTHSQRLQDPAWSPDGTTIAAGKIEDGSVNLYLYYPDSDSLQRITQFEDGEQLFQPVWHPDGSRIFFSFFNHSHRSIYTMDLSGDPDSMTPVPVLENTHTDFRDPAISIDGTWLYFSANIDGIFNIYRRSLEDETVEQVTNVIGGAFMPNLHPDENRLLYSEFVSDGYKIALLDLSEAETQPVSLENLLPRTRSRDAAVSEVYELNFFDDSDISSFPDYVKAIADTGAYAYTLPTRFASS